MLKCRVCFNTKELNLFPKNNSYKNGRASICKDCQNQKARVYRKQNPEVKLAQKYKTTKNKIVELYSIGKCFICGLDKDRRNLCVDHCHTTGKVRGLLCDNCNVGLGRFKDNITLLEKAIKYLNDSK